MLQSFSQCVFFVGEMFDANDAYVSFSYFVAIVANGRALLKFLYFLRNRNFAIRNNRLTKLCVCV